MTHRETARLFRCLDPASGQQALHCEIGSHMGDYAAVGGAVGSVAGAVAGAVVGAVICAALALVTFGIGGLLCALIVVAAIAIGAAGGFSLAMPSALSQGMSPTSWTTSMSVVRLSISAA